MNSTVRKSEDLKAGLAKLELATVSGTGVEAYPGIIVC
jgi:hypothetical protein